MVNGIILIDKPKGLTSYKVVEKLVRKFHLKKAGHLGTLDPAATGLLPVCLNEATKIVQFFINKDKEYEGTMLLGIVTDTGDMEGKIVKECKALKATENQIHALFRKFTGKYFQTPPMYSAIKRDGKRLYSLAREGKQIERKKREGTIYSLKILCFSPPEVKFKVACSKGTYLRSLVNDIGKDLGCGATLKDLRRTKVGDFSIENAKSLKEILEKDNLEDYLIDINSALKGLPQVTVKADFVRKALSGTPLYKVAISNKDFKLHKGLTVKVL
ncbi:MAG TPA: tRNA pseudouridine(55) synthase TruB, partial [Candidatus Omnitrophica bacterium]|nr:tRNA pseudouridine(55) synthase TruB [Candidatus Omnitrophota bacterium]